MDKRGVAVTRLAHIMDGRKLLKVQRHRSRDILCFRPRRRQAHRDELADVTHFAGGEHGLFRYLEPGQARNGADWFDPGQIRSREHDIAITFRHVDGPYPRMCQRAANKGDVLQAGETDIGHVLAAPAHEAVVFLAKQPGSDALSGIGHRARSGFAFNLRH
jgi:hypothetical protein